MDSKDRLCDVIAKSVVYDSQDVVRCRRYIQEGSRASHEFWDSLSARSEARMIEKANRLIELRSA